MLPNVNSKLELQMKHYVDILNIYDTNNVTTTEFDSLKSCYHHVIQYNDMDDLFP
jgi:hypothetical protein